MGRSYTYQDICAALHSAGIGEGDSLFIHSNIGFLERWKEQTTQPGCVVSLLGRSGRCWGKKVR